MAPDDEMTAPRRSSRDDEELRGGLTGWLAQMLPPGAEPSVEHLTRPESNGMSSETLLFEARWTDDGVVRTGDFVARVAPDESDVPVFPSYDLDLQFEVMRIVAERSAVPVPRPLWLETDSAAIGAPFFVMERVDGRVPPDVMPYNMDSWLLEADRLDQQRLQESSVAILAALHSIDLRDVDVSFLELDVPGETPLRRHVEAQRRYYEWMRGDRRFPVLEDTFAWLEANWPPDEGDTIISWGDARIGNIIYDGFEPVAVLDWEMAALGPRGIDLGWMVFIHEFFEHIAQQMQMGGMPHFLRLEDVAATYAELTGIEVPYLGWYQVYAALRHGIVMARIHARQVHFGEAEWPDDLDDAIMHSPVLRQLLAGTFKR